MTDRSIAAQSILSPPKRERFRDANRVLLGGSPRFPLIKLVFVALILGAVVGCRPEQPIVKHRIPKSRSGLEVLRQPNQSTNSIAETPRIKNQSPTDRMVVAIYTLDDATWFFKLNGTIEQVEETQPQWKPFFESVKFEKGKPIWELPENWSDDDEKPMRFATLLIGEFTPPLELAISSLGPNQDLLLNVNRWRGQMGLAPIPAAELDQDTSPLESTIKSTVLFDVIGNSAGSGMLAPFANRGAAGPPFAGTGSGSAPPVNSPATETSDAKFRYDIPQGWEPGATSGMVPVRLQMSDGEKKVQITVIGLPASANEWDPNAKRWANQAGLDKLSDKELATLTSNIDVHGTNGQLIKLISTTAESQSIIAGMVKRGETAWFVKLTGDEPLVSENESTFDDFLESLKFPAE